MGGVSQISQDQAIDSRGALAISGGAQSHIYLGWDIGGTKSAAIVGNSEGEILARRQWPSQAGLGPGHMFEQFKREANLLRRAFPQIEALGVSVGGPINTLTGTVLSPPHLPGWDRVPLKDMLAQAFRLPVQVEHDAIACLQAERLWGAAKGLTHAAYLTAGTGCGAGLLCGGRIIRGPQGQSPEVGHIRLTEDGPEVYGKRGCVESYCSGTGVTLLAQMRFPKKFGPNTDLFEVERSARAGEAEGMAVIEESGRQLGRVCAMLVDMFCVECIIVGSLARYLPECWLAYATEEMQREMLCPQDGFAPKIVPAKCAERLQDLSALAPCVFA